MPSTSTGHLMQDLKMEFGQYPDFLASSQTSLCHKNCPPGLVQPWPFQQEIHGPQSWVCHYPCVQKEHGFCIYGNSPEGQNLACDWNGWYTGTALISYSAKTINSVLTPTCSTICSGISPGIYRRYFHCSGRCLASIVCALPYWSPQSSLKTVAWCALDRK